MPQAKKPTTPPPATPPTATDRQRTEPPGFIILAWSLGYARYEFARLAVEQLRGMDIAGADYITLSPDDTHLVVAPLGLTLDTLATLAYAMRVTPATINCALFLDDEQAELADVPQNDNVFKSIRNQYLMGDRALELR